MWGVQVVRVVSVKESARWRRLVNITCMFVWLDVDVGGSLCSRLIVAVVAWLKKHRSSTRLTLIGHLRPHLIDS